MPTGKPLADATMTAQTLHLTGKFLQVRTNSQGRYSIRSPAFDDIIISAAKQAYQPAAKAIKLRGPVTQVDFSLQPSVRTQANAGRLRLTRVTFRLKVKFFRCEQTDCAWLLDFGHTSS